jgi:hypothetical protein
MVRWLPVLLFFLPGPLAHAQDDAQARLSLSGEKRVLMGQMVRLYVEVVAPQPFSKAPLFPELELPGAIALQPEQMGNSFSERHGTDTWFGVRKRYAVFPQREGSLRIPPVSVRLGSGADAQRLTTQDLVLDVVAPATDVPADQLIVTSRLTLSDRLDNDLDALVVGDAIKRRVRISVEDSLGLLIPPVQFEAPDGINAYPAKPRLKDSVNRGRSSGSRTQDVTYMLTRPGSFVLPEIEVFWFNTTSGVLETETLPALEFTVAVSAAVASGGARRGVDSAAVAVRLLDWLRDYVGLITLAVIAMYLLWRLARRYGPRSVAHLTAARARRLASETRYFADLEGAIRTGEDGARVAGFWRWVDRVNPGGSWSALAPPGRFATLWRDREAGRYGTAAPAGASNDELLAGLRDFRDALRAPPVATDATLNPREQPTAISDYGRVGPLQQQSTDGDVPFTTLKLRTASPEHR